MTSGWIDVSISFHTGMARWPGLPMPRIAKIRDMALGHECNASKWSMSVHTGTHMDAPCHFWKSGVGMDEMPLDATMGPCRVIQTTDPDWITEEEIAPHKIRRGERIIFKTPNSTRDWTRRPFIKNFIALNTAAAKHLALRGVRTVGIDYLSIGAFKGMNTTVHRALQSAGMWIIEGLDLRRIRPGNYELLCLPIKIEGCDGAPARALLRPLPGRRARRG